jgi:hypothetical protein
MDLSKAKSRLEGFNSRGNRKDYKALFWRPILEDGESSSKYQIRIVPSATQPDFPFYEIKFHYNIGRFPIAALSNFGKQDPVEDLVARLRESSEKEDWDLAGQISPR